MPSQGIDSATDRRPPGARPELTGLDRIAGGAAALGCGALVAFSLPPWGWWPLALVGIALFERLVVGQHRSVRFRRGFLFGAGWFAPGMGWMWFLTAPGYVVATALFAAMLGAGVAAAPFSLTLRAGDSTSPGRDSAVAWALALPAAMTLAEAIRFCFPFGGVPLASLAVSQVAGPLAPIARVGGPVLLTWATFQLGTALGMVGRHLGPTWATGPDPTGRHLRAAAAGIVGVLALVGFAEVAPAGTATGTAIEVAFVQGGGPQGTRAVNTDSRVVVERHLEATRSLEPGPDLVVWPENVIDVADFSVSPERDEVAAEAVRLDAPILVGITEDAVGQDGFLNAQVVVLPDGSIGSRYEKVRRVPFGEYMPLRGLLKALGAPVDQVPRDAVAGTGPAFLDTPAGRVGVVISWEVFFGGRGRDGVGHGGLLIINPTNGSSYTGTVLQTQQVASSRLRAIENGRWEVQVSPTGFSAFVSPDGEVFQRTGVSERAVRTQTVELRDGRTIYQRLGDKPLVALAALTLLGATVGAGRRRAERAPAPEGPEPGPRSSSQGSGVEPSEDLDGPLPDRGEIA